MARHYRISVVDVAAPGAAQEFLEVDEQCTLEDLRAMIFSLPLASSMRAASAADPHGALHICPRWLAPNSQQR